MQIGDQCPDIDDVAVLKNALNTMLELLDGDMIVAGHDISDGGAAVALLEMAFAGNCGVQVRVPGAPEWQLAIARLHFARRTLALGLR